MRITLGMRISRRQSLLSLTLPTIVTGWAADSLAESQAGPKPTAGHCWQRAQPELHPGAAELPAWRRSWSLDFPQTLADVAAGRPLVSLVYVPLCANSQIECGSSAVGDPAALKTNLYWGGGYGAVQIMSRPKSYWDELSVTHPAAQDAKSPVLEERVYRRYVPRQRWREAFAQLRSNAHCSAPPLEGNIEQIAVLRAVHGEQIDEAVLRFFRGSTEGVDVSFDADGKQRTEKAQIVGYAGHNRLMDGLKLPSDVNLAKQAARKSKTASFVLACYSDSYFSQSLVRGGSQPLVMTRALMAPEGYVIDAVLRALGDSATKPMLRHRVVKAYATWQKIPMERASLIFAR